MNAARTRAQLYAGQAERLRGAAARAEAAQTRAELLRLAALYDRLAARVVAWSLLGTAPMEAAANANAAEDAERA